MEVEFSLKLKCFLFKITLWGFFREGSFRQEDSRLCMDVLLWIILATGMVAKNMSFL